ncbi:MAG: glycosyltransferase [Kiritimatiellia bacterium]
MSIAILLSVIVPTRNEERNLEACLRCFEAAKTEGWCETIVVDNASTDATPAIARKAGARLFEQAPERSAQRNRGAQEAIGRFLLFLDADMRVPPKTIEELHHCLTAPQNAADAWFIPEIRVGSGFWIRVRNFERSFYNATCIDALRVFRADVFRKIGGYDVSITGFEDWDLDKRMRVSNFRTGILSNALLHDEGAFSLRRHLGKKIHYSHWTNRYREKWGANDPILQKQFGFRYRFFGVFFENGKWKRALRHPVLFSGILLDRFLVGMTWLLNRR